MIKAHGIDIPLTLEELATPEQIALIVYDMQAGIVGQVKDGAKITTQVRTVLEAARRAGIRRFFTRHLSLPRELMGSFQYRMAMAWQRTTDPAQVQPWFLRDSPGFQIAEELQPLPSEAIFDKLAMSAFEGTPLAFALRDCGLRAFVIVGIALEIGIDPTCRHGADLGLIPVLVQDACGAGSPEAATLSLESLTRMGDTLMTDTKAICSLFARFEKGRFPGVKPA
ncbi:MAG: cysteine hydrolase [Acidobacteriaceae bacterium]